MKLAPSILAADFANLGDQIKAAADGGADQIHIDVMDGQFVPNISFGAKIVEVARRVTDLPLDVHLMIEKPENHLQHFADAGASTITVHVEACPHLYRVLQQIRALDVRVGVALNPHTPAIMVSEVLNLVDNILVMTVNPGAGGQTFLYDMIFKIQTLKRMISQKMVTPTQAEVDITVDGGIDASTIGHAMKAGANVFVAGTSVFDHADGVAEGLRILKTALLKSGT